MFASGKTAAVASAANYIEDVFSTYLYTGNGSTQTITNGIDLSTKGGLVWYKDRTTAYEHEWVDTARGAGYNLESPNTTASTSRPTALTAFNTTGFTLGSNAAANGSGDNFVSWTFRKQPKFFDVVTYTGNGTTQNIAHNLGSVPGCIIVKEASAAGNDWQVYHRSTTNTCGRLFLNLTNAENANGRANTWGDNTNPVPPTSTVFTVGNTGAVNNNGATFVAYLFAHNAGGFGLTNTDNVISCGSFTTDGSGNADVNLGYEPQWVLTKPSSTTGNWTIVDSMRGNPVYIPATNNEQVLFPNTSAAESSSYGYANTTSTGFVARDWGATPITFIYIAIRRGPMKVPTDATKVFLPTSRTGNASLTTITSGFAPDVVLSRRVDNLDNGNESVFADKLRGSGTLSTNNAAAEYAGGATSGLNSYTNTGIVLGINNNPIYAFNYATLPYATYQFQRAPSFFDEVCFTNTSYPQNVAHNLAAVPEMVIVKGRTTDGTTVDSNWCVWTTGSGSGEITFLNSTLAKGAYGVIAPPTNTTTVPLYLDSATGKTFVMYLFATVAGVSKVGSYTGTGTTKQIDCGFTGGARFVLIKRTDSTGDWYVWDTARGIVSGNDPYLLLNSTAAEVTNTDYIDTYSAGFEISSTAPAAINASGGTFIFLAIA